MAARRGLYSVGSIPTLDIRLQELISTVVVGWENAPVLSVCQYSLSVLDKACRLGVYGLRW